MREIPCFYPIDTSIDTTADMWRGKGFILSFIIDENLDCCAVIATEIGNIIMREISLVKIVMDFVFDDDDDYGGGGGGDGDGLN